MATLGHSSVAGVGPRKEEKKEVEMEEEMEVKEIPEPSFGYCCLSLH